MSVVTVGVPNAFTSWNPSVRVMERFLREMGVRVVTTPKTTPGILKTATTVCSADFCIPVRVLVGHVYALAREHPDLDAILVPNVCREHPGAVHCSKYRDISGIVIRSIAGTVGYLAARGSLAERARLAAHLGADAVEALVERGRALPRILQPEIWSLDPEPLFHACYRAYAELTGARGRLASVARYLPERLRRLLAPHYSLCRAAFAKAYEAVITRDRRDIDTLWRDPAKPRLAVIGRSYLHDDPLITADLKPFFRRKGCVVVTPHDLPFRVLREGFARTDGFYDTHRTYQAFLDLVGDRVDGVIVIGAFGCHPDAFENLYFLDRARLHGLPAWLLKYDEQSSSTGFLTRYETMLGFLEQRRDQRLARARSSLAAPAIEERAAPLPAPPAAGSAVRTPVLVWPHVSPIVDVAFEELLYQAGLGGAAMRPALLSSETIEAGNYKFTESCCPYALTTGSLILSVRKVLQEAETDGRPRRIILLQGRGDGPCTYGWYARLQREELPKVFARELEAGGHTMEMATLGGSGLTDFVGPLVAIGNVRRLAPILELARSAEQPGGMRALSWWQRRRLMLRVWRAVHPQKGTLTGVVWAKMEALEAIRAQTLVIRAHERHPGATTAVWRRVCEAMRAAHSVPEVALLKRRTLQTLAGVEQDQMIKPRVLVVGEIYVALASFANRGTVDTLLGREGIEVIEGTTLLDYVRQTLRVMRRGALIGRVRPLLHLLTGGALTFDAPPNLDLHARPFVLHSLGGDGRHSVSAARHAIERLGVDGVVHVYPFKCMPEMMAKTALVEIAHTYGVKYLPLDFDKELDVQRLRTEVSTFAAMLRIQLEQRGAADLRSFQRYKREEQDRRRSLGAIINQM